MTFLNHKYSERKVRSFRKEHHEKSFKEKKKKKFSGLGTGSRLISKNNSLAFTKYQHVEYR